MATLTTEQETLEVVLTFPDLVSTGTAINVQTGVYAGGGPATVNGDTITFPATAVEFNGNGGIEILLNGVELEKGLNAKCGVLWASTTQITLPGNRIFPGNKVTIRSGR